MTFRGIWRLTPWASVALALAGYSWSAQHLGSAFWGQHAFASTMLGLTLWRVLLGRARAFSDLGWWAALWLVSIGIHYRIDVFYHWDDYDVLSRFAEYGLGAVLRPHNEHFLPLGLSFYYLETRIFGIHYGGLVLVSTLLHATTAALLTRFLLVLAEERTAASVSAARALSLLWLVAGVHIESMNWAFIQLNMLCEIAMFLALTAFVKFLRLGETRQLLRAGMGALLAPLCFGNGLRLPLVLGSVLLFELIRHPEQRSRRSLPVALGAFCLLAACSGAMFVVYGKMAGGSQTKLAELLPHVSEIASYLFVGTQLATVLRGIGLFPSVYLEAAQHAAPAWSAPFCGPELFFAFAGLGVSALLLLSVYRLRLGVAYWLLGQLMIVAAFALPSLARWKLGLFQALAMRYQYNALSGLVVALYPLCEHFYASSGARWSRLMISSWMLLFLSTQLFLAIELDYFTVRGRENRAYLPVLRDWYLGDREHTVVPPMPSGLTPSNDPLMVYRDLHFLDPRRFPKNGKNGDGHYFR